MKLLTNKSRTLTEDGLKTYKFIGLFFSLSNKIFNGNIIIRFKFGFKDRTQKDGIVKVETSHSKLKGFRSKYLEILFIEIPKGK
jgi:hypothetical protein